MSDNQDRCANYLRLISMVIDLGTEAVLLLFYHLKPRKDVAAFLAEEQVKQTIGNLKKRKILKLREYNLVTSSNPIPDQFDLNLLITLLSNVFRDEIETPTKGWDTFPPASGDFSIGADLLRLRRIKNDIVSHHIKAQLPSTIFCDLWQEVQNLLLRIVVFVDTKNEADMKDKLSWYATRPLNTMAVSNAMDTVKLWYDQVNELQKQVEDLAKKANALCDFFQEVPTKCHKYYTLLVDGGRKIMLGIWDRVSRKYDEMQIKSMLTENKHLIMKESLCADSKELLLPKDEKEHFDASKLDILVLGYLILLLFKRQLDTDEEDAIKELITARKNYAETAFLSNDTFMNKWTDLVMDLQMLAKRQSSAVERNLRAQIKELNKEEDKENADRCIKELTENVSELKQFSDVYKETTEKLQESLRQMREEGIPFGEEKIVVLKMYIRGSSKENSELAEAIVDSTISKALEITNGSNDYKEIVSAVDKILNHVRSIDGANFLSSHKGCILLSFGCTSYSGLLELLDYFESDLIQEHFYELSFSLSCHFEDEFIVSANVTQESIVKVQDSIEDQNQEKQAGYIPIKVSCATASSMSEVYNIFNTNCSPDVLNAINKTAEVLSEELGDKCCIEIRADLGNNWLLISGLDEMMKSQCSATTETSDPQNVPSSCDITANCEFGGSRGNHVESNAPVVNSEGLTTDMQNDGLQSPLTTERVPIKKITDIRVGDVVSLRYFGLMHDVIVTEVQSMDNKARKCSLKCIHYGLQSLWTKPKIVEEYLPIDLKRTAVYKLQYGCLPLYSTAAVISRASGRIGERKWNFHRNRSENLCFWAKVKSTDSFKEFDNTDVENSVVNKVISLFINGEVKDVHLAEELQIGDVVYFKDYGILVDIIPLDGQTGRKFRIELIVYDKDWYIRRKNYSIDLNKDFIFVKRYHPRHCVPMKERVERAKKKIDKKCKWWTTNGFIKDCIMADAHYQ